MPTQLYSTVWAERHQTTNILSIVVPADNILSEAGLWSKSCLSQEVAPAEDDWAKSFSRLHRGPLQNKQINKRSPAAWRNPNLPLERAVPGLQTDWATSSPCRLAHFSFTRLHQRLRRNITRSRCDLTTFFFFFKSCRIRNAVHLSG